MAVGEFQNLLRISISSASGHYEIIFQKYKFDFNQNQFYLIDSFFRGLIRSENERVIWVDANEQAKTLSNAEKILLQLSEKGMTKKDILVVVGGGAIQDIGTLVSALYMRGVNWIYVPTTLAAMGDSCIGGKSSINVEHVKNLVGNFYPPKKVIIDTDFCRTLPLIEFIAGISEIIKICYAHSNESFRESLQILKQSDWKHKQSSLIKLITLSLLCKKYFVEEDEFDTGIRKLLNFGHSFGHALESASKYQIPHGVAILIGMIAATQHEASIRNRESELLRVTCFSYLREVADDIRKPLKHFQIDDFCNSLAKDKKNTATTLVLILSNKSGLVVHESKFDQGALKLAATAMENARTEVLNEIC